MKETPATIATRSHQSAIQLFARKLRTRRRRINYLRFPRKRLRGAVNGMTWPPCSIGSGVQTCPVDQSMHMVGRGVGSFTISAFCVAHSLLYSVPCSALLNYLFGYNKNSFRISDLNCRTVRWKPSLCPRMRDHPVGFGYRNYFPVNWAVGHGAACSQVEVEVVIKTKSVEFSHRLRNFRSGFKNCNGKPRTGIRLAARTIAGAHIREAAAPIKMFLRVIR